MNPNQQIEQWLAANKTHCAHTHRPFVTLSYAQSLDGSIAARAGEPLALSGPEAMRLTHHLRSMHDGILVGIGTVLADDPQLTVRHWPGLNPQPIVLDSRLRMPASARLCQSFDKRCWVLTTRDDNNIVIDGLEITALASNAEGRVCLEQALKLLWDRGIRSLMVEGGANIITAFLTAGLADALVLTITPTLVGGYKAVSDMGPTRQPFPRLAPLFSAPLGDDVIVWGNIVYDGRPS